MKPPKRNPNLLPAQKFTESYFQPYSEAIGQATLAWNSLHEALGLIFWAITGEEVGLLSLGIWNEIKVDRTKRDILMAAAKATTIDTDMSRSSFASIKFLFEKCRALEDARNNAIHAPLSYHILGKTVKASVHQGNPRAENLLDKDILKEFKRLYETALILRDYALAIEAAVRSEPATWPVEPKLPDQKGAKLSQQPLPKPPAKPSRRPQS